MPNMGRMWRAQARAVTQPFAHANASVVGNSYKSIILPIKHTSPSYTKQRFTTAN